MKRIILFCSCSFLLCLSTRAQTAIDTAYFYEDPTNHYYYPKQDVEVDEILNNTLGIFTANQNYSFQLGWSYEMEGKKFMRFDQYSNGVKLNGNSYYVCSTLDDIILTIAGRVLVDPLNPPAGVIPPEVAVDQLLNQLNYAQYKWDDPEAQHWLQEETLDPSATYYPSPTLQIYKYSELEVESPSNYYYTYPICISARVNPEDTVYVDSLYLVDGFTGEILSVKSLASSHESYHQGYSSNINPQNDVLVPDSLKPMHQEEEMDLPPSCNGSCLQGGVTVHYYGGQNIYTAEFTYLAVCTHRLKDNCTGTTLYVRKQGNSNWNDYRSTNNSWPNQSDKVGITGLWCLERAYDCVANYFNYHSYNNQWSQLNLVIDNQQSAWLEATNSVPAYIEIGLFQNTSSYQVTLDCVGHEYGHGILLHSSGLGAVVTQNAEEFVVVEGFCDIMGQLVEHYTNTYYSTNTSNIDDFVDGGNNPNGYVAGQTRSMSNPNSLGNPDTYGGNFYLPPPNLNSPGTYFDTYKHQNSTVFSHWFYLLSQGGSGTNDLNNQFCVSPLGQINAGKIAFLACTFYINNYNKTLYGAYQACMEAAKQLFGVNSHEVAQTGEAWYAVGVAPPYVGTILIQNHTATGTEVYQYNNKVDVKNFTSNAGSNVTITSGTQVGLLSDISFHPGSLASIYITPTCGSKMTNSHIPSTEYITEAMDMDRQHIETVGEAIPQAYPNPTNGSIYISNLSVDAEYEYSVNDLQGAALLKGKLFNSNEVHLADLSSGIYLIYLTNLKTGENHVFKITKV